MAGTTTDGAPDLQWIETGAGYDLALKGKRLVARNAKGKVLSAVPKPARETEAAETLLALRDLLARHDEQCVATGERWMLGSLPIATAAIVAVWPDPSWQAALRDAVLAPVGPDGRPDHGAVGFLRGAETERGLGIVDLDGESTWLDTAAVTLPHPVLLDDLDDLRAFGVELGVEQDIPQLLREVHHKPDDLAADAVRLNDYANGEFEQLRHVASKAQRLGYPVRGGYATCRVWDDGREVRACYWVGADDPEAPAWTGDLNWVDEKDRTVPLGEVGPVAWSEGVRMAALLYADRKVAEGDDR